MNKETQAEPWAPVSIGVDVTSAGAHVVGIYALDADTSQIFYAKYHHAPQRTWVGLTAEEREQVQTESYGKVPHHVALIAAVEARLKEKNT